MFISCKDCDWGQDDFYSISYNPAKFLSNYDEYLFGDKHGEINNKYDGKEMREIIADYYLKYSNRIRKMKWFTYEDFKKDPDKKCPKCSSTRLSLD